MHFFTTHSVACVLRSISSRLLDAAEFSGPRRIVNDLTRSAEELLMLAVLFDQVTPSALLGAAPIEDEDELQMRMFVEERLEHR